MRFRITAGNNIVNQTVIYLRNVGLNEPAKSIFAGICHKIKLLEACLAIFRLRVTVSDVSVTRAEAE